MADIVLVDFAGTLIKTSILEEANKIRSEVLQRATPTAHEHANKQELYEKNRDAVNQLTGLPADAKILYRTNTHEDTTLSGEQVQNMIATTLFQIGMYGAAKKHKQEIVTEDLLEELKRIKEAGYELAIASGVRTDIITGMLAIADITLFDHVIGQPPILGVSNHSQLRELASKGKVAYVIGDKTDDLKPAKEFGAKSVWVTWGHPRGDEETHADYVIHSPHELRDIIN